MRDITVNNLKYFLLISFMSAVFSFPSVSAYAQQNANFQYINPIPNSSYVSVKTNIIIRQGTAIDKSTVNSNLINVSGSFSGIHSGKISLSDDSKTLIFKPDKFFHTGEEVAVVLKNGIRTVDGKELGSLKFVFRTSKNINNWDNKIINPADQGMAKVNTGIKSQCSLPANLPRIVVNKSDNPSPGYLFLAPTPYLMLVDNEGTPIFYREFSGGSLYDFNLQPNGEMTFFIYPVTCLGMDSSFNIVRHYVTTNGFSIDVHELCVLPDGGYYILGKRPVEIDMSKIITGGDSAAIIIDGALQEFDPSGNLIFQWDALDHYKLTDADSHVDLTQHQIDFVHFNAIELEKDGNILISARNLDEVTKIDHNTGDIIWRLGGKNNQFTFINDNRGFSRQHDIRRFSNGDISLFDNGNFESPPYSSFVEYKLDEVNKTATLINRYVGYSTTDSTRKIYSPSRGMIQELPNGNRLISWGESWTPAVTEILPDNSIAYEMSYASYEYKYRAYRYNWKIKLFSTNTDSVNFGKIASGDSVTKNVTIYNPKDSILTINQFYLKDDYFSVRDSLPITIQPKDSVVIKVQFKPADRGVFYTKLNIRTFGTNQMIARQVKLYGTTIVLINTIEAPTDLKASLIDSNQIRLTWSDNSVNETNFVIERENADSNGNNNFTVIDTVNANDTVFIDTSVKDSVDYSYRIYALNRDTVSAFSNAVSIDLITGIIKENTTPAQFRLMQNYPNPFNPSTRIYYEIPKSGGVILDVYNILGQRVITLVNKFQKAGKYSINFNGSNLPSGIYFYKLSTGAYRSVKKLLLLK